MPLELLGDAKNGSRGGSGAGVDNGREESSLAVGEPDHGVDRFFFGEVDDGEGCHAAEYSSGLRQTKIRNPRVIARTPSTMMAAKMAAVR